MDEHDAWFTNLPPEHRALLLDDKWLFARQSWKEAKEQAKKELLAEFERCHDMADVYHLIDKKS